MKVYNNKLKVLTFCSSSNIKNIELNTPNLEFIDLSDCRSLEKVESITDEEKSIPKVHSLLMLRCMKVYFKNKIILVFFFFFLIFNLDKR